MRYAIRLAATVTTAALLSSCGMIGGSGDDGLETASSYDQGDDQSGVSDTPSKLGAPFTVGSTTYTPADVPNYDEVGYASYYGSELAGRPTANGEIFLPGGATAAHKTLPMPTYVEVTALDTGRTILVRVNDRGPFANDRLIDLSEGAARQLGIVGQGVAGVRVRKVNPPEQERAVLRGGMPAAERIETPDSLLKVLREKLAKMPRPSGASSVPKPVASSPNKSAPASTSDGRFIREGGASIAPKPSKPALPPKADSVETSGGYSVQIGAFSSRSHAQSFAKKAGAKVITSSDGRLFRVRLGPYSSEAEAERGLAGARQRGYSDAKLVRD